MSALLEHTEGLLGGLGTSVGGLLDLQHVEAHGLGQGAARVGQRDGGTGGAKGNPTADAHLSFSALLAPLAMIVNNGRKPMAPSRQRARAHAHNTHTHRHWPTVTTSPSFTRNAGETWADSVLWRFSKLSTP